MGQEKKDPTPRPHIQTLSDLVFGLTLSIGALTLVGQKPVDAIAVAVAVAQYAFIFLIIVNVWRSYSTIMSVLPVETSWLIDLNILLLFLVSVAPYLFNQVLSFTNDQWNAVSVMMALDLGAMFVILAFFHNALASEERKLVADRFILKFKLARDFTLLVGAVFFISVAPVFYTWEPLSFAYQGVTHGIPMRAILWISTLLLSYLRRPAEWVMTKRSQAGREVRHK